MARHCNAISDLMKNMKDVDRLLEIHKDVSGDRPGRRHGLEVLHKSGVVLITACWEGFVEDLAVEAFDFLLSEADTPDRIPAKVRAMASKPLKDVANALRVWDLAGEGWRQVLKQHKKVIVHEHVGKLNTPRPAMVDSMFEALIGMRGLSSKWYWPGMSYKQARSRLDDHVTDRRAIAHRTKTKDPVGKAYVEKYRAFVYRLAVKSTNSVCLHIRDAVGAVPWTYTYRFQARI